MVATEATQAPWKQESLARFCMVTSPAVARPRDHLSSQECFLELALWAYLRFRILHLAFPYINKINKSHLMSCGVHLEIIKSNYFCEFGNYVIIVFINNVNNSKCIHADKLKLSSSLSSRPTPRLSHVVLVRHSLQTECMLLL
jgi:hypothetical protein